jgi:hypothetical protein
LNQLGVGQYHGGELFSIDLSLNISYPHPMKHKDDIYFYFAFVICIGFTIILLSLGAMDSRNKKLQAQIDELRVLFNQKFLQEMAVNKPYPRDFNNNSLIRLEF